MRWNAKIIGKSSICKGSTTTSWENDRFSIHIADIDVLKGCTLSIELWQSKASGIIPVGSGSSADRKKDVLMGYITLTRSQLESIFTEGSNQNLSRWMNVLTPCPYLPEAIQLPPSKSTSSADAAIEFKCSFVGSGGKFAVKQQKTFEIHLQKLDNLQNPWMDQFKT